MFEIGSHKKWEKKLQARNFSPNRQGLERDTVLKCIFCILWQQPRVEAFQNCNRIDHAHPLIYYIWIFEGWPFILKTGKSWPRREYTCLKVLKYHLGHPRVTVACQLDWALFPLGLDLAKSTSLATRRMVTNHSRWTPRCKPTSSKDIWSGGISIPLLPAIHSYTCTWRFGLLPDKITCVQMYGMCCRCSGCSFRWTHSIVWDSGLTSRVKGVYLILECSRY
jgi:hypothetical protein